MIKCARTAHFDTDNQVSRFLSCVLFVNAACIEGRWAYLVEIQFVQFLMMYLVLLSSFDGNFYIWKTCGKKWNKNYIPCQAVCNMFEICELPEEFRDIWRLERVLVPRQLLFKETNIMLKGQPPKWKGALCNIPIDVVDVCNRQPH